MRECHDSDAQRALCAVRNLRLPMPAAEAVYRLTTEVAQPCPALVAVRAAVTTACESLEAAQDAAGRTTRLLHETERRLDEEARDHRACRDAADNRARQVQHLGEQLALAEARADDLLRQRDEWYARVEAVRAHIAERTHGDCDGDNPQWDGGFKAACSQILAVLGSPAPDDSTEVG